MKFNFLNKLKIYFHLNRFDIIVLSTKLLTLSDVFVSAFSGGLSEVSDELHFKKDGVEYTLCGDTLYLKGTNYICNDRDINTFNDFKLAINDLDSYYKYYRKGTLSKELIIEKIENNFKQIHFIYKYSSNLPVLSKFKNELERLYYLEPPFMSSNIDSYTIDKEFKLRYDVGDIDVLKFREKYINHFGYFAIYKFDIDDFETNSKTYLEDLDLIINNLNHEYPDFKHYYNLFLDKERNHRSPFIYNGNTYIAQSRLCIYSDLVEHKSIIQTIHNGKIKELYKSDIDLY